MKSKEEIVKILLESNKMDLNVPDEILNVHHLNDISNINLMVSFKKYLLKSGIILCKKP